MFFIRKMVRFYLPLLSMHFTSAKTRHFFDRQWGGDGAVGRIYNGAFILAWFSIQAFKFPFVIP